MVLKTLCVMLKLCTTLSGPAMVSDGDTLIVEGFSVRLEGLDAEELNEPHGLMAKRGLLMMIAGQPITCKLTGLKTYERNIGTCYSHTGIDLAQDMVRFGYALDCARYSNGKYRGYESQDARRNLIQKPYC